MEGPADPGERVEAICAGIRRLAPFEPACVLFLTGPGDDRRTVLDGIRAIADRRRRRRRPGRARADPARVRPVLVDRHVARRGGAAPRRGRPRRGRAHVRRLAPVESAASSRSRAIATASPASTSQTGETRRGTRTTACSRATASSSSVPIVEALRWDGLYDLEIFSDPELPGLALERRPAGARAPRRGGAVTRVCVVGGGVIGSLYAAHLARVTDVSVLCRREEHAAALNEHGLRVSGRHEFTAPVRAATDAAELPRVGARDRRDEDDRARRGRLEARRSLARGGGHDRPERPGGRGGRPPPRRLETRLRRHLHERDAPRGHARRVHPRHRDVARPLRRDTPRAWSRRSRRCSSSPG